MKRIVAFSSTTVRSDWSGSFDKRPVEAVMVGSKGVTLMLRGTEQQAAQAGQSPGIREEVVLLPATPMLIGVGEEEDGMVGPVDSTLVLCMTDCPLTLFRVRTQ